MPKNKKSAKGQDLTKKIMKEIRQKKVKMRPRIYFIAGSLLLSIGLAGTTILAIFFINLVLFRLRIHQPFGFLILGRPGLRPFLLTFPWLSLLVALGGIIGGRALLKKYDISYKKKLLGINDWFNRLSFGFSISA